MKLVPLTQGRFAKVCDCHYSLVSPYKWMFPNIGYACRSVRRHIGEQKDAVMMHRVIAGCPSELETDHLDEDKLNNQCVNLENVTHRENIRRYRERRAKR